MSSVFAVYTERFSVVRCEKYQYQLTAAVEDRYGLVERSPWL